MVVLRWIDKIIKYNYPIICTARTGASTTDEGLSAGVIVAIVLSSLIGLVILALIIFCCCFKQKRKY